MAWSSRSRSSWLVAVAGALASLAGCSTTDSTTDTPAVYGPPSLALTRVGGLEASGLSTVVDAPLDDACGLSVVVVATNFALRPPVACFGYPQCGQLWVDAGSEATRVVSAGSAVSLPLGAPGTYTVTASLHLDGALDVALDAAGKQLTATVQVVTRPACGGFADAGGDVEAEASLDAGDGG